jgi:hypothetical protein
MNSSPFSDDNSTTILQAVQAYLPIVQDALKEIVVKKPVFQGLPINGVPTTVPKDLQQLQAGNTAFEGALSGKVPVSFSFSPIPGKEWDANDFFW